MLICEFDVCKDAHRFFLCGSTCGSSETKERFISCPRPKCPPPLKNVHTEFVLDLKWDNCPNNYWVCKLEYCFKL